MAIYQLQNVSFTYPSNSTATLSHIDLSIDKGDFVLFFGTSGSGKSTLLRHLKKEVFPQGSLDGQIFYNDFPLQSLDDKRSVSEVGMVFQNPDTQIIMGTVHEELTFAMENLGFPTLEIQRRTAEIVTFFGMNDWLHQSTHTLSGGQKQLLNLASIMMLRPKVLLLDEPTSQLDPIATKEFLSILRQLNQELSITIILTEHRLENIFPLVNKVYLLSHGQINHFGTPQKVIYDLWRQGDALLLDYLPSSSLLYLELAASPNTSDIPVTIKDAKSWFDNSFDHHNLSHPNPYIPSPLTTSLALKINELYFQYTKDTSLILKNLTFNVSVNSFLAILGGNGSGKSTLLKCLSGILKPTRGKITTQSSIGYLAQNPMLYFNQDTVQSQLESSIQKFAADISQVNHLIDWLNLEPLLDKHPYDISGGEQQKLALALILLSNPDILLLDEPTKGLDPFTKKNLSTLLHALLEQGKTIIMVSHDMEFVAKYTTHTTLMFDGTLLPIQPTKEFFYHNYFYTTTISRIVKETFPQATQLKDVINSCQNI